MFFREAHRHCYPTLWHIALDVLPMQASSVPCERVFSSSKETMTPRRSSLSPRTMEVLQVLKFGYRQDRLNFMTGLVADAHELACEEVSDKAIGSLLAEGHFLEALSLLKHHSEGL
jgi:hypothetical protein